MDVCKQSGANQTDAHRSLIRSVSRRLMNHQGGSWKSESGAKKSDAA
ncbi:hypothetical protein SFMTTN_3495 [Sulfuriferula multivorans]|uniref:Uncharacterized protein n=1 Tax=Sulfuriferula multivorans TaxID=1559896 RepID=A0A401JHT5_9PROT|nr:hypothetical protein SFMTTN_3495 [Sulfuriferula multivorans]